MKIALHLIAASQQNHVMHPQPYRTPIHLFTAITRAVRDQPMSDAVRHVAFDLLTQLADQIHEPQFERAVEQLLAFAQKDVQLQTALGPFAQPLRAMSTAFSAGNVAARRDTNEAIAAAEDR